MVYSMSLFWPIRFVFVSPVQFYLYTYIKYTHIFTRIDTVFPHTAVFFSLLFFMLLLLPLLLLLLSFVDKRHVYFFLMSQDVRVISLSVKWLISFIGTNKSSVWKTELFDLQLCNFRHLTINSIRFQ